MQFNGGHLRSPQMPWKGILAPTIQGQMCGQDVLYQNQSGRPGSLVFEAHQFGGFLEGFWRVSCEIAVQHLWHGRCRGVASDAAVSSLEMSWEDIPDIDKVVARAEGRSTNPGSGEPVGGAGRAYMFIKDPLVDSFSIEIYLPGDGV